MSWPHGTLGQRVVFAAQGRRHQGMTPASSK
jgi:hypothetical protein